MVDIDKLIQKYKDSIKTYKRTLAIFGDSTYWQAQEIRKNIENDEQIVKSLEETKANRWISVKERLPEQDGNYLITRLDYGEEVVDKRHYNTHSGFVCSNVTAWKPLPEPYKESEAEKESDNDD